MFYNYYFFILFDENGIFCIQSGREERWPPKKTQTYTCREVSPGLDAPRWLEVSRTHLASLDEFGKLPATLDDVWYRTEAEKWSFRSLAGIEPAAMRFRFSALTMQVSYRGQLSSSNHKFMYNQRRSQGWGRGSRPPPPWQNVAPLAKFGGTCKVRIAADIKSTRTKNSTSYIYAVITRSQPATCECGRSLYIRNTESIHAMSVWEKAMHLLPRPCTGSRAITDYR